MKRNELKQLYDYYVQHTAVVEKMESVEEIDDYLEDKYMDLGVCNCARWVFEIYCYSYFRKIDISYPTGFNAKPEILSVLNQRIELLRSELLKNMQKFADKLPSGLCKVDFDYLEYRGDGLEIDIDGNNLNFKGNHKYLMLWVEN
jgi:hypothetical protein